MTALASFFWKHSSKTEMREINASVQRISDIFFSFLVVVEYPNIQQILSIKEYQTYFCFWFGEISKYHLKTKLQIDTLSRSYISRKSPGYPNTKSGYLQIYCDADIFRY